MLNRRLCVTELPGFYPSWWKPRGNVTSTEEILVRHDSSGGLDSHTTAGCIEVEGPANGILNRYGLVMRAGQGCSAFTKPAWYPGSEPGIIMRRFVHELIEMAPHSASYRRTISNAAFVLRA